MTTPTTPDDTRDLDSAAPGTTRPPTLDKPAPADQPEHHLDQHELAVHTVTVDDSDEERYCPHTYLVHAHDLDAARTVAREHHMATFCADYRPGSAPPDVIEGRWWTFTGIPTWPAELAGRTWQDLREDQVLLARARELADAEAGR